MIVLVSSVALACLVLGGMNLYQAITGRRLSTRPSTRSDAVVRRQSTVAGTVLVALGILLVAAAGMVLASL